MGKSPEEFPALPQVEMSKSVRISDYALKEIIHQTIFSVSDNENTDFITG